MIRSEYFVEIPCSKESFMVTFELITMHVVLPGIVKKKQFTRVQHRRLYKS